MNGAILAPQTQPDQRKFAIQVNRGLNDVKHLLEQVYQAAKQFVSLTNAQDWESLPVISVCPNDIATPKRGIPLSLVEKLERIVAVIHEVDPIIAGSNSETEETAICTTKIAFAYKICGNEIMHHLLQKWRGIHVCALEETHGRASAITLVAQLVENKRVEGKPRQKVLAYLYHIKQSDLTSVKSRSYFWYYVAREMKQEYVLTRLTSEQRRAIIEALHKTVPLTDEEFAAEYERTRSVLGE